MQDNIKGKNSLGGDVGDEVNVDVSIHSLSLSFYICYIQINTYGGAVERMSPTARGFK